MDDDFESLQEKACIKDFLPISITEDKVLECLNKLNINKSEGPDLIHPRVLLLQLQLFYDPLDFVWDYPGEPVPER